MTLIEQEEYFASIEWFGETYNGSNADTVLVEMFERWPKATLSLINQGFFLGPFVN